MKRTLLAFLVLSIVSISCRWSGTASPPDPQPVTVTPTTAPFVPTNIPNAGGSLTPTAVPFVPTDVPVGDPNVNYANVEFTSDGKYMVWFEMARDGSGLGTVWQCGVNPETGELIPPDGKGFRAFESSVFGRANPGTDSSGVYYAGIDRTGNLLLVRPTGPTSGQVSVLSTPPDVTRRSVYPTVLPDQSTGYIFWIKNASVPGAGTNRANAWVELQYISLADPTQVHVIERQDRPLRGMAPMDIAFARWMRDKPILTYGFRDTNGVIQIRAFDASRPNLAPQDVTNDPGNKIDPYSWFYNGREILIPGINAEALTHVYVRNEGETWFTLAESIVPPASALAQPALAQSNEPIVWNGQAYTVYQVNEKGSDFWDVAFGNPGEIWLSTTFQTPQQQWLLTDSQTAKAEPEPYMGTSRVWVFYNIIEGKNVLTALWSLRRAETPLRKP